jgi:hypothetical protein
VGAGATLATLVLALIVILKEEMGFAEEAERTLAQALDSVPSPCPGRGAPLGHDNRYWTDSILHLGGP